MISLVDALPVLMELQFSGDRVLRKLAFLHVVQDIRRMNIKNKNEPTNKPLQTMLFNLLQVFPQISLSELRRLITIGHILKVVSMTRC